MRHTAPRRRTRAVPLLAGAGALALGAGLLAPDAGPRQATAAADTAAPVARVWVTTPDRSSTLEQREDVAFTPDPQGTRLAVDPGWRGQEFVGAGASVTEASAHLISGLPAGQREELLRDLFSPEDGIGLNYLRQPLGSTDFNSGGFYTYEDTPGEFSIDRDREQIIPVVRRALDHNPDIRFMGSPWSAPAWMKDNGSLNGGSLRAENHGDYADYLVRAVQEYAGEGIVLSELTVQNEPLFETIYPSMYMSAADQAAFLRELDGALGAAGLDTGLYTYDHNWDRPDYPLEVLAATADLDRVRGAAFHCYGGRPEAQQQVADTGAHVFFTECSGTDSDTPEATFRDTLRWQAENLVVRNLRSGGETVILWNLALDAGGGPHQGNCQDRCNGVVEIDGGRVAYNAEYYLLGHLTGFVDAGARRIGSEVADGVQNVVFDNPDGTRTAYVVNTADSQRTFSLGDGGAYLPYTLPAGAVATFVWTPQG
ncbi:MULTISPECIES: glycoside hydrolase family 30 protein [unclassified Nocardiopsis]|uniref:glycoside hydrolase family 30 protein n=1 Tax=Nocardiopsis TaxID=2013 RepID=UPI00387B0C21